MEVIQKTKKPRSEKQLKNDQLLKDKFNEYHKNKKVVESNVEMVKPINVKQMAKNIENSLQTAIKEVEKDLKIPLMEKRKYIKKIIKTS